MSKYKAEFLYPYHDGSIEQAGYELANAQTEGHREMWWKELKRRIVTDAETYRVQETNGCECDTCQAIRSIKAKRKQHGG